jgi:hypothetical protein
VHRARAARRFTDGTYSLDPAETGPVDYIIDPKRVAFLLVVTGRLPAAAPIALGLWRLSGNRPKLALGLTDLVVSTPNTRPPPGSQLGGSRTAKRLKMAETSPASATSTLAHPDGSHGHHLVPTTRSRRSWFGRADGPLMT